jgi:hypothetical protein
MAQRFPRSQQMASIALTIIGLIGYLDVGAIFTHVVFLFVVVGAKKEFLIPAKKAQDVCWEEVWCPLCTTCCVP